MATSQISGLSSLSVPTSAALLWLYDGAASPQDRSLALSDLFKTSKKSTTEFTINAAGGAIGLTAWSTANLILTYAGASTVTLPQASSCIGYKVKILAGYAGAGLVTITPYTGDRIDLLAANVSIFLNNSDGGANIQKFRYVELIAIASGFWAVVGGDFCPDQAVDTDGSHLCLGRLHHLPQTATNRLIISPTNPPAAGAWSSAITAAGVKGVPSGAKAIRVRADVTASSTAAGSPTLAVSFPDNNSVVNTVQTYAIPYVEVYYTASAGGQNQLQQSMFDIPLNASGQFYIYTQLAINVTLAASSVSATILGYYMGD
jgi:hypothetical protein